MIHVHLRGMYILLFWGEMFFKCQLSPFDLVCHLMPLYPCDSSEDLSIVISGMLKCPIMTVLLLISSLKVHQDVLNIFRCSRIECMYVYKGYVLLLD